MDRFELWLIHQIQIAEKAREKAFNDGYLVMHSISDSCHKMLLAIRNAYHICKSRQNDTNQQNKERRQK
jgi:hypothetical protein